MAEGYLLTAFGVTALRTWTQNQVV